MNRKLLLVLLFIVIAAGAYAGHGGHQRKVLILGIDGCRPDALQAATAPNIDTLIARGFYTYDSWCPEITISAPAWSSMMCGVYSPRHGVTNNTYTGSNFNTYPYFTTLAKSLDTSFRFSQYAEWAPMSSNVYNDSWDQKLTGTDGNARNTAANVTTLLQDAQVDMVFGAFDLVDITGHSSGFSASNPSYVQAIDTVDYYVGRILAAMRARPAYAQEDWLVLIATNHGGIGTGHGGVSYDERHIWWVGYSDRGTHARVSGPQNGSYTNPSDPGTYDIAGGGTVDTAIQHRSPVLTDIAATALHHLIYSRGIIPDTVARWHLDGKSWLAAMGLNSARSTLVLRDTITSAACNGTSTGSVQLTATGGRTPYQYKKGTGSYQSASVFSSLAAGTYKFYVKDSVGAVDSVTAVIAQSSPINITGTVTLGTTQYITTSVTGGVGPYHYYWPGFVAYNGTVWVNRDSSFLRGDAYPSTLFGGNYLVIVTDQNGCTAADSFTITPASTLRFTTYVKSGNCYADNLLDTLVLVGSGGTPFGGPDPYAVRLGSQYTGFTNTYRYHITAPGYGFATFEDGNDYSSYYRISFPAPLVVTASSANTSGGLNNGSITITPSGAQAPYIYTWSGSSVTTSSRTGLAAGTYTVTVREVGGCSAVRSFTITGPPALSDTIANVSCYGSATGMVALHVTSGTAPFQYKKGTGSYQSSNRFTGLVAGTYKFYVLDSLGGKDSITAVITQPAQLTATGTVTNTTGGLNNGAISTVVSGGRPPYHYAWTGSSVTTSSRFNLASGAYYLTVTDSSGCGVVDTFVVAASTGNAVILYLDTVAGNTGQPATIHVKVKNFKKIVSAQASIQFTPSVITYASLSQFGIGSLNASNFGTGSAASGILTFAWSDPTLSGVTLTDGAVLFAITCNVVGASGTSSPVSLVNSPTQIEVADTSFNPIPYAVSPGLVTVNSSVTISGRISSWNINKGVRKTTVSLAGNTHTSVLTDTSGRYSFTVAGGAADTITPSRNSDSIRANGVTTVDVLMVQRYILGSYAITGPYKLIAADVNGSGSITSLDYTLMQSLILGNSTTFPGNKLWTFVPSSYTFTNPQSPWGYPTSRYYASASTQAGQDFTGIKLGDVSGDWNPLLAKTQATDSLHLYVQPAVVHQGQDTAIAIRARYFRGISGMQFTLAWDSTQLTFTGIDSTSALHVNYGSGSASAGLLGIQWTDPNGAATYIPDDSTLFRVNFHVIGAMGDSSLVRFDSVVTTVQFIDSDLNIINAALQSGKVSIADPTGINSTEPDMITIYPNPATSEIMVDLGAASSERTEIYVRDISGKTIYTKDLSGHRNHSIPVSEWAEGVYMIQVRYAEAVKTLRLIVLHP